MPRGSKEKYTDKQKRQAEHIEEGYEERGLPEEEAERRAWATVNKMTGGGKKPGGSGRGKKVNKEPAKKGGRLGGAAAKKRSAAERSTSAKKAAQDSGPQEGGSLGSGSEGGEEGIAMRDSLTFRPNSVVRRPRWSRNDQ